MKSKEGPQEGSQVLRFIAVGLFNTALGYGLFAALWIALGTWWHPLFVLGLTYILGSVLAFLLHRRFVFYATNPRAQSARRYVGISLSSIVINFILLQMLSSTWGLNVLLAQALSLFVAATFSFFGLKFWTFKG